MHDPRIGRFFTTDPLAAKYPHNSPYAFSENRVIDAVELEGLESCVGITSAWFITKIKAAIKLGDKKEVTRLIYRAFEEGVAHYGRTDGKPMYRLFDKSPSAPKTNKMFYTGFSHGFGYNDDFDNVSDFVEEYQMYPANQNKRVEKVDFVGLTGGHSTSDVFDRANSGYYDPWEGGAEAGNIDYSLYGEKGLIERGIPLMLTTLGTILSGGTLAAGGLTTGGAVLSWSAFVNGVDDLTTDSEGATLFVKTFEAIGVDESTVKTLKAIVSVADARQNFISHLNTLGAVDDGTTILKAIESYTSTFNAVNSTAGAIPEED
ncbi:MAG: hypothetical protein HRT58_22415 [Crocinitomicaceae bacterium]|nr:hypothetical protein [Flavobacteriales bacterium]NQZ38432.1 hypothetical protein [Crocinitomicaceae bacterium]